MDLPHSTTGWLVVALLVSSVAKATDGSESVSVGPPSKVCARDQDELWLISTRHLCFPDWSDPSTHEFDVRRYDRSSGWQDSSFAEFLAGPNRSTVVYVHANRFSWSDALRQGHLVYESLGSCAGVYPPMRFVIWSWPSDRIRGAARDVRVKAARADTEGSFFGWFLSQLKPGTAVELIGFSYGARIISGGLQLLSGGSLNGHSLPELPPGEPLQIRAVYLAAAMDVSWLYPGGYHGQSLSQLVRLLITYNECDPALKHFRFTDPCTRPTALGFSGIYASGLGEAANRVEQVDVSQVVGRTHDELRYWCSSFIVAEVCRINFESPTEQALVPNELPVRITPTEVTDVETQTDSFAPVQTIETTNVEPESSSGPLDQQPSTDTDSTGRRFQRSGRLLGRARR